MSMTVAIGSLWHKLVQVVALIPAVVITTIFAIIPTHSYNPANSIPQIEEEMGIKIPNKYKVVNKQQDFFGFDLTIELTMQFEETEFSSLLHSLTPNTPGWVQNPKYNYYSFYKLSGDHSVQGEIKVPERELVYKYWEL